MIRLVGSVLVGSLSLVFATGAQAPAPPPSKAPTGLDVVAIDRAMGKSGAILGDVYKISLAPHRPERDGRRREGEGRLRAGQLGGVQVRRQRHGRGVVHGDLVLLDSELNAVISGLQQHDFKSPRSTII